MHKKFKCPTPPSWGADVESDGTTWEPIMQKITSEGYQAILSTTWYLDLIKYPAGGKQADWTKYYATNPTNFTGGDKSLVIGGEGAWWTEYIDSRGFGW